MASVYGVVRTLIDSVPSYPSLRNMLRRRPDPRQFNYADIVEREIVPRLMISHGPNSGPAVDHGDFVTSFAPLALVGDAAMLLGKAEALLDQGFTVDQVLIDVLAPAARRLGAMWEDDEVDFVQVTMALWRLQEVVREVSARVTTTTVRGASSALFSVMPGEQHSFGTVMIEDVFRRQGWETDLLTACDRRELLHKVAENEFDVIGLTVSADRFKSEVAALVRAVRGVSRNPRASIMLGGRAFAEGDARTAAAFGADAVSGDARSALVMANSLVDARRVSR